MNPLLSLKSEFLVNFSFLKKIPNHNFHFQKKGKPNAKERRWKDITQCKKSLKRLILTFLLSLRFFKKIIFFKKKGIEKEKIDEKTQQNFSETMIKLGMLKNKRNTIIKLCKN